VSTSKHMDVRIMTL